PQVSSPQVSSPQVSSPQVSSPQVSSPPVSSPQSSSPQVPSPQVSSPQVSSDVGTLVAVVLETMRFVGGSARDPPLALAPTPHFPGVGVFLMHRCVLFATAQNNRPRPRDCPIPIAVG